MKQIYLLKYVVLFLCNSILLQSQDLAQTLQLANEQMDLGNYHGAIALYSRVSFFGDKSTKLDCSIAIGDCYFSMNDFSRSIQEYNKAIVSTNSDSLRNELYIRKAYSYLSQNNFNLALDEIKKMEEGDKNEYYNRKLFHLGLIEFLMFSFQSSEKDLLAYTSQTCPDKSEQLKKIFKATSKIQKRKKSKLWLSSVIIPGSGQLLNSDYRNGVNSLLLNCSLFALTYYVGYQYGIPDAALTVFPWSYRYYSSGIKKSHLAAKDRVKELHGEVFNEIIELYTECQEDESE